MFKKKAKKTMNTFLAATMAASAVVTVVPGTVGAEAAVSDLIISEYIEGSSFNKALELYNGTASDIDLSQYTLELYSNGATEASQSLNLTGILASGGTFILYHGQADEAIQNLGDLEATSVINFNGDDALVLKKDGTVIDSIGQVGTRNEVGKDKTLVRHSAVTSGDTTIDDAFDASEWTTYPKDTFEHLGNHVIDGSDPEENPEDPPKEENPGDALETISMADARTLGTGEVAVKGTVTAVLKNTVHIQDETGAIAIHPASSLDVSIGDIITVQGELGEYRGLLQVQNPELILDGGKGENVSPILLTGAELNEDNESKLATVENVTMESVYEGNGWANYTATDGTEFIVRDETGTLDLTVGTTYESITGIVQEFDGAFQIIPRNPGDIIADSSVVQAVTASPAGGTIPSGTEVTLSTATEGAEVFYSTDGSDPVDGQLYTGRIVVEEDIKLKVYAAKDGLEPSAVTTFEYSVYDPDEGLQIHDIQGETHESQMNGTTVQDIQGIVTYTYKLGSNHYFHMQTPDEHQDDNPNTSEGMVVFTGNHAGSVKVGDLVHVTGTVDEYHIDGYYDTKSETDLSVTQINARDDRGGEVTVIESNVDLPEPVKISEENLPREVIDNDGFSEFDPEEDAIDYWESLEGMRVEFGDVKAVAPQEHGDLITVFESRETDTLNGGILLTSEDANPDRIQFKMFDNYEARDFAVATGDAFEGPIVGVVNYGFQNYKIYVDYEEMQEAHIVGEAKPEQTTIEYDENKLTIASYNLENFSNNRSETSDSKAAKLARAFVKDMNSPDIIGVTEVQDNNGQDAGDAAADESYERLIQEIVDAGGPRYAYANIDPVNNADGGAPNANIRVGFLYNPDRVSLTDGTSGDATTSVGYENGVLTHNPGRIDPNNAAFEDSRKPLAAQFEFQGEEMVVIVNHWNSKSGDTPLFGSTQPPVLGSEEQRKEMANVVYDFIEEMKADNPDANIVSVGDFNDFQFSDAIKIHEGKHMKNMINEVEESDRYTYLFQGNSQVLDHILVSNNLADSTEIDILHINADFTDMAGRASDHDPVMVQVDLSSGAGENDDEETPEELTAEKTYDFSGLKTKELIIGKPSVSITLDAASAIENGVTFKGEYAEFHGDGFKDTFVVIDPENKAPIIDFHGIEVSKVYLEGDVKEIRGAENIGEIIGVNIEVEDVTITDSNGEPIGSPSFPAPEDDYYVGAYGKEGEELKQTLHEIIDDHHELSYKEVWNALKVTDEDPNNPNNVMLLYSGESRAKNKNGGMVGDWNREHTWAKSHGDFGTSKGPGTDIHHLRPTDVQVNSSRGNLDFDEGGSANVKNCAE